MKYPDTTVTVTVPLELPREWWLAVMNHPTTMVTDDKAEFYSRLGWLLCAWDVLMDEARKP